MPTLYKYNQWMESTKDSQYCRPRTMGLLFISHKYIVIGMDHLILACLPSLPYKIHLTTLERLGHTYLNISKLYPDPEPTFMNLN